MSKLAARLVTMMTCLLMLEPCHSFTTTTTYKFCPFFGSSNTRRQLPPFTQTTSTNPTTLPSIIRSSSSTSHPFLTIVHSTNNHNSNNESRRSSSSSSSLEKVPEDDDKPIAFFDGSNKSNFIECYADSIATLNNIEYTIGTPCDYAVALCYFDDNDQLVPIELDEDIMDDIFSIAEKIVEDEFGEELSLQRTPQTLTLLGELEEDSGDDEDDEDDDNDDEEEEEVMDGDEEEVEILLSFDHDGKEYNLVRLLDPVLLVGKMDPENPNGRILLSVEESDEVMPQLEDMFLQYQEEHDNMTF